MYIFEEYGAFKTSLWMNSVTRSIANLVEKDKHAKKVFIFPHSY